jgi:peptidoglycan/LPS O-acetylase OafA/YrhL
VAISLALAVLGTGAVLAWRRAAHGRPSHQPAVFATLLLLAGFLAPSVATLALTPAARPLVVPCALAVVLVLGFAACVRPALDER